MEHDGREARSWRRLALSAAGTVALLTARIWAAWPSAGPVRGWLGETLDDELWRRLRACEASIQNLWEAHNARDADHR